jgi:Xaa-Pro aminopeptidase
MSVDVYRSRRGRLFRHIGNGIAFLPTASEKVRSRDAHYPYRPDSYFHYLTGFGEPEAVLVMLGGRKPSAILFCREKNEEREIWDGFRHGPKGARKTFGFDQAWPIATLEEKMPELLSDRPALYYPLGEDPQWDEKVMTWLSRVRAKARAGVGAPARIEDIRPHLDEMRLIKDRHELGLMRRAAAISVAAHRRAMRAARPGRFEYEIEAELLHAFRSGGAHAPAYTSIVAGGANACVLHYIVNDRRLDDGDLLLIDAGCEYEGYAADITRTFPVNGRFSAAQREVYGIVLSAQLAAISAVRPGASWRAPHQAALKVLTQGMVDLKLLKGSVDGLIESEAYRRFYMHRTGHWLGMDVHDAGDYKVNGKWRRLEPGMVLTVEPGLYIRPEKGVPKRLANIGIRIEDDVLVTRSGREVLTEAAPKTAGDIEDWMKHG